MKFLVSTSFFLAASALSLPAFACEFHGGGGGMFGQLNRANWTEYSPTTAESDEQILETKMEELRKRNAALDAKPKPSFSKVSVRASMAAKARLVKQAKRDRLSALDQAAPAADDSELSAETAPR